MSEVTGDATGDSVQLLSEEQSEMLQAVRAARPGGKKPLEAAVESEVTLPGKPIEESAVPEAAPAATKTWQIGDKEFNSEAEALAYAQSLYPANQQDKVLMDAYRQGIQDAQQAGQNFSQQVTQPAQVIEQDDFDTKFFANPKQFLTDYAQRVREEAKEEALKEMRAAQAEENLWSEFFTRHPDLDGFRQDCEQVALAEREAVGLIAKAQGKEKALDYIARKTRSKFQTYMQRMAPQRDLPQATTKPTPSGGERVTQAPQEEEAVDFVSTMRKMRNARNVRQ